MSIVSALGQGQAPLGAAFRPPATERMPMPLLAELVPGVTIPCSYRHGAPHGAFGGAVRYGMFGQDLIR